MINWIGIFVLHRQFRETWEEDASFARRKFRVSFEVDWEGFFSTLCFGDFPRWLTETFTGFHHILESFTSFHLNEPSITTVFRLRLVSEGWLEYEMAILIWSSLLHSTWFWKDLIRILPIESELNPSWLYWTMEIVNTSACKFKLRSTESESPSKEVLFQIYIWVGSL